MRVQETSRWWLEVPMQLADLLRETLDVDCDEVWENEHTPTPLSVRGAIVFDEIVGSGDSCSARITRF